MILLPADDIPIAIVMVDRENLILYTNPTAETLFGYDKFELLNKDLNTLVPHGNRKAHYAQMQEYWKSPTFKPLGVGRDLSGLRKDGSTVQIEISLYPYKEYIIAFVVDIKVRKMVAKLQEDMAVLKSAYEKLANTLNM